MKVYLLLTLFLFTACNGEMAKLTPLNNIATGDGIIPVVTGFIHSPSLQEDVQRIISLSYTGSDEALSCSVSGLSDVLISRSCLCIDGFCSVGIRGTSNYNGPGSFQYSVTDPDGSSNSAIVNFSISDVDDKPVTSLSTLTLPEGGTGTLTLNYTDVESDLATSCDVYDEDNMTVGACSCDGAGVCTVSVTGDAGYDGTGTLSFTVSSNALTSSAGAGRVNFTPSNTAPAIDPISDQMILGNRNYTLPFTISDADSPVTCGDVTSSSSNDAVILDASITISGTAPNCQANIVPVNNATGDTTITFELSDGTLSYSESFNAKVYGWGQKAYIKPSNNLSSTRFGSSLSLDGNALAVGAPERDSNRGGVYVFRKNTTSPYDWVQDDFILAGGLEIGDKFGTSVYLSFDTLAVGTSHDDNSGSSILTSTPVDDNGNPDSGVVYIYSFSTGQWEQEAYLKASNAGAYDYFGSKVALHRETLAVSAPGEDSSLTTIHSGTSAPAADELSSNSGAVYIYTRNSSGLWEQQAYIKPDNTGASDEFGNDLSLHGNLLAVGAHYEDSGQTSITTAGSVLENASNSGAVYIFSRSSGVWTQEAYIKASNSEAGDLFGASVSIEGSKLAVGAPYEDSSQEGIFTSASMDNLTSAPGAVYVYKRTGTSWALESYIKPENSDRNIFFGSRVSLKGETLVVGVYRDINLIDSLTNEGEGISTGAINESGAAYVYRYSGTAWIRDAYLKPTNLRTMDQFGAAVSASGDMIAVSSPLSDGNQNSISNGTTANPTDYYSPESGAVYIFENNSRLFDVTEVAAISDESSITLNFQMPGGTATGYIIKMDTGTNPPGACLLADTTIMTNTYTVANLFSSTDYSFRICATNGASITEGATITVRTQAPGDSASADVE